MTASHTASTAPRRIRQMVAAVALSAVALGVSGCQQPQQSPAAASGSAAEALEGLRVRAAAEDGGDKYDRAAKFQRSQSEPWLPTQGNCDMRDYILARDLTQVEYVSGSSCDVGGGTLHDAYTMNEVYQPFGPRERVQDAARPFTNVDIEHVVSLGDAWVSGAGMWAGAAGQDRRVALANDSMNLLAASAQANISKSDSSFDLWPAKAPEGMFNQAYTCDLAARQIYVKDHYDLSVTAAEKAALARALQGCPGQELPSAEGLWWNQSRPPLEDFATVQEPSKPEYASSGAARPDAEPTTLTSSTPPAASSSSSSAAPASSTAPAVMDTCAQVWDALGRAITRDDAGFQARFDGNGDGVGCEKDPR